MTNETELINNLIKDTQENENNNSNTLEQNSKPIQAQTDSTTQKTIGSNEFTRSEIADTTKPTIETPKKGRGRPRKTQGGNTTQGTTNKTDGGANTTGQGVNNENPLDFSEFKETTLPTAPTPNGTPRQANEINAAKFITGSILLMVCDAIIPTATIKVLGMFDAKYKQLKTKNIKLSQEQKKDLEPLADECVKAMTLTMQPTTVFFITMFILYGSNIMNTEI